jgi:hypothetical protein
MSTFKVNEEISIIFVSESNIILCSGSVSIIESLEMPVISAPTFKRLSEQPGETKVSYEMKFEVPTYIRQDSYFHLRIPYE